MPPSCNEAKKFRSERHTGVAHRSDQVAHVAMESTASYWKPVYNLLEMEDIQILVVNAKHIKNVPGRKTDVKDAKWIAGLLHHGLLQGSYIPSREQRGTTRAHSISPKPDR
jgi:transposase